MEKKTRPSIRIAALVLSVLPLAALLPSLLRLSLPDAVRTAWAIANVVFVLLGLLLSALCVRRREGRSTIHIASALLSALWALLMAALAALALLRTFAP